VVRALGKVMFVLSGEKAKLSLVRLRIAVQTMARK